MPRLYINRVKFTFVCRVEILATVPGMQQMVADYARHNHIKLPKIKYSLYGGQVISRGFKEKLLSIFGGWALVRQMDINIYFPLGRLVLESSIPV